MHELRLMRSTTEISVLQQTGAKFYETVDCGSWKDVGTWMDAHAPQQGRIQTMNFYSILRSISHMKVTPTLHDSRNLLYFVQG